jgi:hypothetical protein
MIPMNSRRWIKQGLLGSKGEQDLKDVVGQSKRHDETWSRTELALRLQLPTERE